MLGDFDEPEPIGKVEASGRRAMGDVEARVRMKIYPFTYADYEDVNRVMSSITSHDRDAWAGFSPGWGGNQSV